MENQTDKIISDNASLIGQSEKGSFQFKPIINPTKFFADKFLFLLSLAVFALSLLTFISFSIEGNTDTHRWSEDYMTVIFASLVIGIISLIFSIKFLSDLIYKKYSRNSDVENKIK